MTLAQRRRLLMSQGKLPVAKPVVSGAKTYNGAAQSVTLAGYDSATMTLGGTRSAVNAGSYAVTVALKDTTKYQWADGTTDTISLSWGINWMTCRPTFSPASLKLIGSEASASVTITWPGGGYATISGFTDYIAGSYERNTSPITLFVRKTVMNKGCNGAYLSVTPHGVNSNYAPVPGYLIVEASNY